MPIELSPHERTQKSEFQMYRKTQNLSTSLDMVLLPLSGERKTHYVHMEWPARSIRCASLPHICVEKIKIMLYVPAVVFKTNHHIHWTGGMMPRNKSQPKKDAQQRWRVTIATLPNTPTTLLDEHLRTWEVNYGGRNKCVWDLYTGETWFGCVPETQAPGAQ